MLLLLFRILIIICAVIISNISSGNLQHDLDKFHSMQANFKQIDIMPLGQKLNCEGTVWIEKPDHFRWQVQSPNIYIYVADGKNLWAYDVDLLQVTKQSLQLHINKMPMLLLSSHVRKINNFFTVTELKPGYYHLVPKNIESLIRAIDLVFNKGVLQKLTIYNSVGQVTIIQFDHVILNTILPVDLFRLKLPKGIDILRLT